MSKCGLWTNGSLWLLLENAKKFTITIKLGDCYRLTWLLSPVQKCHFLAPSTSCCNWNTECQKYFPTSSRFIFILSLTKVATSLNIDFKFYCITLLQFNYHTIQVIKSSFQKPKWHENRNCPEATKRLRKGSPK